MKSINITFQHGHIYNTDTGERIIVEEDKLVNYILIFEKESDIKIGKFEKPDKLRTSLEIIDSVLSNSNVSHIKLLRKKGEYLYFFISEEDDNNEEEEHYLKRESKKTVVFRLKLLEDLYLYRSNNWTNKELLKGGKLVDCACVVDKTEFSELPFFEKIYSKSVTSLYKKTHIHYFGNAGSPSKNAFDCLYLSNEKYADNLLKTLRGFDDRDKIIR